MISTKWKICAKKYLHTTIEANTQEQAYQLFKQQHPDYDSIDVELENLCDSCEHLTGMFHNHRWESICLKERFKDTDMKLDVYICELYRPKENQVL